MKNLKTLLLIALITLGFNSMQAQGKLAHIDLGAIIKLMPETITMNSELEKLSKTYTDDLRAQKDAIDALTQKYTAEAPSQTDEENTKRAQEIQQENYKIELGAQYAEQDINNKGNEMMEPIYMKAQQAIKDVAKELGFDYVIDATGLLVAEGTNLTIMVKTKLGISSAE